MDTSSVRRFMVATVLAGGVVLPGRALAQPAPTSPAPLASGTAPASDPGAPPPPLSPTPPAVATPPAAFVPEGENPPRAFQTMELFTGTANEEVTRRAAALRGLVPLPKRLNFSGFFWVDTGYMSRLQGQPGQYDQAVPYMQGRFVLGASYWHSYNNWFALAKVQLLGLVNEYAKNQYEPHTLDAYAMIGHKEWFDFQIGRFLGWEVYRRGQGIELFTAEEAGALNGPKLYWLDLTRGYKNESGQAAVHFYPHRYLKFEVAGVYGQESNQNNLGVRPVADFSIGNFKLIGGMEYLSQSPQSTADKVSVSSLGAAGRAQYRISVLTLGINAAWLTTESLDIQGIVDTAKSQEVLSFGGYADIDFWRVSIGLGYHRTNADNRRNEHNAQDQAFASVLFVLPVPGLSAKAVYGFARAYVEDRTTTPAMSFENLMHSVRVRLAYEFN